MADKNLDKDRKVLADLENKSSSTVYGMGTELGMESDKLKDIIKQTMVSTSEYYGSQTSDGKVIDYFNEINFAEAFAQFRKKSMDKKQQADFEKNPKRAFKKYMSELNFNEVNDLMVQEAGRVIAYNNYRAIYTHVPEAAQALDTYKDNIMSPDDFTKMIFNVTYDNELDEDVTASINNQLEDLTLKYELEDLADEIIGESLILGDQYLAVLSLEEELDVMLNDPIVNNTGQKLNEQNVGFFDLQSINVQLNEEDVDISRYNTQYLTETFTEMVYNEKLEDNDTITEDSIKMLVSNLINENVQIGSKKELLLERISAEQTKLNEAKLTDIPTTGLKPKKGTADDDKPMFINGSTVRLLDASKVVELKIDNVIYGYYVFEDVNISNIPNTSYLGGSQGREVLNPVNMGANIVTTNNSKFSVGSSSLSSADVSDSKVKLISKVFLDVLSKKIDKDFVRHNKEFKDFIYNLIRQDYIVKKQIKMTYFPPDEIINFKVPALYRKIVFFAKLYIANLINMLLIKMGRAHDKRIFTVDIGADMDYEQAISKVIHDIKTKEFKMDMMGEINTILNLTPGRFDDYYIPSIGGEKPIEIDTLQGMDIDMNNDFIEFLKDSMLSGIGIPRTLIDATKELDYARTLSAQNANFVRNVIKYQKKFTLPFTKLYRKLYQNEYKFTDNKESDILDFVNINDIKVEFPSPATLNISNMVEQLNTADAVADLISSQYFPQDVQGLNEPKRLKHKAKVLRKLVPGLDWDAFDEFEEEVEVESVAETIKEPAVDEVDPYAAY